MKFFTHNKARAKNGFGIILAITSVALTVFVLFIALYNRALNSQEDQKKGYLNQDYSQREEMFLGAMLYHTPLAAIELMKGGASTSQNDLNWDAIFTRALADSSAFGTVDTAVMTTLGVTGISGNPGDVLAGVGRAQIVGELSQFAGSTQMMITSGVNQTLGGNFPAPLRYPGGSALDSTYPIITDQKIWGAASAGQTFLPPATYPTLNLIEFPDLIYEYLPSGSTFIAKRNWWAFELDFSAGSSFDGSRAPKRYILSIYEIPSQLPIEGFGSLAVGTHSNGQSWGGAAISGTVFGKELSAAGGQAFEGLASQRDLDLDAFSGSVGSFSLDGSDLAQGAREDFEITNSQSLPVAAAQNSGRVAVLPISRGLSFYDLSQATTDAGKVSPTGWDDYSIGAARCAMRLIVREVAGFNDQTPTVIEFQYYSGGTRVSQTYTRGSNWPFILSPEGQDFPFHQEDTEAGRPCISLFVERLQPYISSLGGDGADVNHSITFHIDYVNGTNVSQPNAISLDTDIGLILKECQDLTPYTEGFSLVSHTTLFIAADLNIVEGTPPSGSTVPTPYFPPVSLFSPHTRFGITANPRLITVDGQLGSLRGAGQGATHILDLKSGQNDQVIPGNITAALKKITHPDQLPPIYNKTWLITIHQIN